MRIGIDACCWSNHRGFGRFTRELVTHLTDLAATHEVTLVVDEQTASQWPLPAKARVTAVPTREQPTRAAVAKGARAPADLWRLSSAASRGDFDVFLFPAVYSFYPLLRRTPTVVAFHDAIAEDHPALVFPGPRARLLWTAKTWLARRQADRVLTVSESARLDVVRVFGIPEDRIRVVPEGAGSVFRPTGDAAAHRAVRERYRLPPEGSLLLHVGGLSPHKNLVRLLDALSHLGPAAPPWHLALVGDPAGDAFLSDHPRLVRAIGGARLEDRVTLTGFVPDHDLALLYNAATMLVFPSLAEGFGLPALEAMACGLPVAASRRGALPEVLGGAGLLFDPEDPRDMAGTILRLLADQGLRARLGKAGLERSSAFSWTTSARLTLEVLEEAAGG